ncbi:NusB antitermination factor [Thermovibrio ammonificans HB-1]|uniref:Transcription antitermination protein NusB n=1 Tax=Thermovibrio ammonificans (strain DSM 15698 / JCM 12110 / HB-1) TaxID=648996 RepID=E8T1Y1_THEA1|nr:transcription antitermination factor NusB [Thermovibrio ammonificans]ADU96876.1 NusB antitermination factor [Thermovibrio ammonificans HB-1]
MALTNREKKKAREHACLIMYQVDVGNLPLKEVTENYWSDFGKEKEEIKELSEYLVKKTIEHLEEVDRAIGKHLKKGWVIERLLPMDRSILRVASYEILNEEISPPEAVINDAVEIAKSYGEDEKSPKFINAILDKVKRDAGK